MIVMLHGADHVPNVWRAVSDNFPASWGVVAPRLHHCPDVDHMNRVIINDLHSVYVQPPLIVVAYGEAAIPAAEFCAHASEKADAAGDIAGLLIADPCIHVTPTRARTARIAARLKGTKKPRGKRERITDASPRQRADYLSALAAIDAPASRIHAPAHSDTTAQLEAAAERHRSTTAQLKAAADAGIKIRILAAEKAHAAAACGKELHAAVGGCEFFSISGAEPGWNAYAPSYFAANVCEFVQQI